MNNIKAYTIQHMYKDYIKDIEEHSPYYLSYSEYKDICVDMFQYMRDKILLDSSEIKLPFRLGTISIIKKQPTTWSKRYIGIDYKASKELGKTVYHINDHSNGFKFMFKWNKSKSLTKNKSYYQFKPTRDNKRTLASLIFEGKTDYFEV